MGVRGSHVDDVDVGIGDELFVGAVCRTGGRDPTARDKLVGLALGRRRGNGYDLMGDVRGIAGLGILEEITDKHCTGQLSRDRSNGSLAGKSRTVRDPAGGYHS